MTAPLKRLPDELPRWSISEHAVDRYLERVRPGVSRRQALTNLLRHVRGAHFVKTLPTGIEQWRGPKPRRLRLRVERCGCELRLVSVIEAFDGLRKR